MVSNLTISERAKLPASSFGDPSGRRYPITTAADVMAAAHLIGKAAAGDRAAIKRRIIKIAKAHGWPIPDAWK